MPGLLSRSKSMRLLKGHRRDVIHQEQAVLSEPSVVDSQTEVRIFPSATPHSTSNANLEPTSMPTRPSTSGGPGERRTQFHLRANPAQSQRDLPFATTLESGTVLSSLDVTGSREGIIGIALGSPTLGSHWNSTPQAASTDVLVTNEPMASLALTEGNLTFQSHEPAKSKLSRWKSLFKKNGPPPQQEKPSFYQLAHNVTTTRAARADSHHDDDEESVDSPAPSKVVEDRGRLPSPPTFKPDIRASRKYGAEITVEPQPHQNITPGRTRALTAGNLPVHPRMSVQRSATTPIAAPGPVASISLVPQIVVPENIQESSNLLLDVNIPDIKMERYSIMFGNLLQTTSTRSSSLFARRQGNTEKLAPLNALSIKEEQTSAMDYKIQRRATSPTVPSPSPRLSLFPNTSNSRVASPRSSSVPRTRTLHRSKTVPEKSPLHQTFRVAEEIPKGPELFVQKRSPAESLAPHASTELDLKQATTTPTSIGSLSSESGMSTAITGDTGATRTVNLESREPEWEICNQPSNTVESVHTTNPNSLQVDSRSLFKVTKFSALSSNPASAPLDAPSPLQRISSMRSPPSSAGWIKEKENVKKEGSDATGKAMVGVARSISVSRANSPRALGKTGTDVNSPERFIERQALTPTMVEVKNRRSQRVQLVDA